MIEFSGLNYWAILAVWFLTVVVGAWWYSPMGFQKLWSKLSGVDMMKMPKDAANRAIGLVALSAVAQSVVLAVIVHSLQLATAIEGLGAGLLLWFGFTAATTVGNTLYSRLSLKFWWLNASFFLVVMTVGAIILAVWR